jgi:hypothetical protein
VGARDANFAGPGAFTRALLICAGVLLSAAGLGCLPDVTPTFGTLAGDCYSNSFLGLSVVAPTADWIARSGAEVNESMIANTRNAAGDPVAKIRDRLAVARSVALLALVRKQDAATTADLIAIKKRFWMDRQFTIDIGSMVSRQPGLTELTVAEPVTETLGRKDALCISGSFRRDGVPSSGRYCLVRLGRWSLLVYEQWHDPAGSEALRAVLQSMRLGSGGAPEGLVGACPTPVMPSHP